MSLAKVFEKAFARLWFYRQGRFKIDGSSIDLVLNYVLGHT